MSNLHKKYNILNLSAGVDDDTPATKPYTFRSDETEYEVSVQLAHQQSYPSTHYVAGRPTGKDNTAEFDYSARGIRGDVGVYWQTYISDSLVGSSVNAGYEGLVSGTWTFEVPSDVPENLQEDLEEEARWLEDQLLRRRHHFKHFLKGWIWGDRIYGFSLWEIVDTDDGELEELAYIRPNVLDRWIFSEDGREWVGVRLQYRNGNIIEMSAGDLLHYSTGVGLDLEGWSALRPVVRWVEAKQLVTQIELAASEAHGSGYVFIEEDGSGPVPDADDAQRVVDVLSASTGQDIPIIKLGSGYAVKWESPNGRLPDFEGFKRYCDEQISLALQSTGSLVGLGDTGTYNLAEVKDSVENIRRVRFYGESVCDLINERLVPRLMAKRGKVNNPRFWPKLTFSLQSEAKDPQRYDRLAMLVKNGVLSWSEEDENQIREELDLAPRKAEENQTETKTEGEPQDPLASSPDSGDSGSGLEASHTCAHQALSLSDEQTEAERAIESGSFVPMDRPYVLAQFDTDEVKKWLQESANNMGSELHKVARKHREAFVAATKRADSINQNVDIAERLNRQFRPQYAAAIRGEVYRMAVKGSAAQLRELGVLSPKQGKLKLPNVPKNPNAKKYGLKRFDPEFDDLVDGISKEIAYNTSNRVTGSLVENARAEITEGSGARKKPEIPTKSALTSVASTYKMEPFSRGQDLIIKQIRQEAQARGIDDTRVVAEFSSALEDDSCEPCMNNDGRRYFVGSNAYERDKPPYYRHEGPKRTCLCLMSYILPSEKGYENVIEELQGGGSTAFSQDSGHQPSERIQALRDLIGTLSQ